MNNTQKQPASVPPGIAEALEALILVVGLTAFKHEGQRVVLQEAVDSAKAALAAYGREQAQPGVLISHDSWAELVARHPETMQVLFGGQA